MAMKNAKGSSAGMPPMMPMKKKATMPMMPTPVMQGTVGPKSVPPMPTKPQQFKQMRMGKKGY